jgi:predicted alpha-1,2-mannosidase
VASLICGCSFRQRTRVSGTVGRVERLRRGTAHRLSGAVTALGLVAVVGVFAAAPTPAAASPSAAPGLVADPAGLVNPVDGTGTGPVDPGTVGEFPGADLPFGMLQWSPDTSPAGTTSGGGYSYGDSTLDGFSLTHLSGTGCPSYGDVPILPTVGPVGGDPAATTASFAHDQEHAAPGQYGVVLGPAGISAELAVTTRTGLSQFVFPPTGQADVLFKVADSANPATAAAVRISGRRQVSGSVTSGGFCGTGTRYTLYFVARFDRPFASVGSWTGAAVTAGSPSCAGPQCGAYVTFDTRVDRTVAMQVGISFVSPADAEGNLRAEHPGWSLDHVRTRATDRWNAVLGRIGIGGGTAAQQRTFYTALYHSLLDPSVDSDVNGAYAGADGQIHPSAHRIHYANFSEWDIYRSEIELVALLAPHQAGDMVQSLVDDAGQDGWLPKWAIVGGDESQMNGDSADPIIAAAYAFGVRNFDVRAALAAMVKGATEAESGHGLEIERQYLDQYLGQHYVDAASLDLTSIDYSIGGSVTLEYALDDFAIARVALGLHDRPLYAAMMQRAHNWEYLFNPATGYVQARGSDGSFPRGPVFQPSMLEPGGQLGFEEGNAVQYTWSVPQDLASLAALMGGDGAARNKLDAFFASITAGRDLPWDWAGNEPSLWTPWEYDSFGAPAAAQATVRRIADDLYADAPVDEPGNDDLGALSSWYVWAAMGMYPVTPGTADLALASPLFPEVVLTLPDGRRLTMEAPGASASTPYIHSLVVSGVASPPAPSCTATGRPVRHAGPVSWTRPWLPGSIIRTGGTLAFGLTSVPDPSWGSDPGVGPPSYGTGGLPAVGFSVPSGGITVRAGDAGIVRLGAVPTGTPVSGVRWRASGAGLTVTPDSGVLHFDGGGRVATRGRGCATAAPTGQALVVTAPIEGTYVLHIDLAATDGTDLPPVVVDVDVTR